MDYDNDGILDFISGSYDPGDIYLFRGLGDGEYAKAETILDEDDQPLVHHPVEFSKYQEMKADEGEADSDEATTNRVASFGSWAASVDWDADDDLDMLIGSFGGGLFLRENIGTRSEPKFSRESIQINSNGKPLKENCHACPVVADWDGDGLWDLVVGSGDGSVGWYKNNGSASSPRLGSRNLLVLPAQNRSENIQPGGPQPAGIFFKQTIEPGESPVQGARAQICVTDYNGDGLLDLVVGDHSDIDWTRELSEKEKSEFEKLKAKQKKIGKKLAAIQKKLYPPERKESSPPDDSAQAKLKEQYRTVIDQLGELDEKRKSYFADSRSASFIWLYPRISNPSSETFVSSKTESSNQDPAKTPNEDSTSDGPVTVIAKLETSDANSNPRVCVTFEIKPQWHLYANETESGNQVAKVELVLPSGVTAVGDWEKPEGEFSIEDFDAKIYTNTVTFSRDVEIEPDTSEGVIELKISYQVCNEKLCLPPTSLTKTVKISK